MAILWILDSIESLSEETFVQVEMAYMKDLFEGDIGCVFKMVRDVLWKRKRGVGYWKTI